MKGLIFYFSGTGTTKLAVEYIAAKVKNIEFDLHDMNNSKIPDIKGYDILGFATFAQLFNPPEYVESFMEKINKSESKYAFVFNTFGLVNGNTLNILGNWVKNRGDKLIGGFALHTPESSPVMIGYKITSENSPNKKEVIKFNEFIRELDDKAEEIKSGRDIKEISIRGKEVLRMVGKLAKGSPVSSIGEKYVDKGKCIKCKLCQGICPYEVISFKSEYPEFDEIKCKSCFICYNKCPTQAIYSRKHNGIRYTKPNDSIIEKLKF